jgi:hypothetical protein
LVSITFLPHVNDLNVALLNSLRQTLVQVMVHIIQVEVWVMKDLLDKLFEFLCVLEPLCCMIKQKTLTL